MNSDWQKRLSPEKEKPYFQKLMSFLEQEYRNHTIYPVKGNIFNALEYTSFEETKVVILGQDPYHGANQAHGLSFSVQPGVKIPPSLRNIYKELATDIGCPIPNHGCLISWAKQGVLLLNTVLTVREGEANAHRGQGWEEFTNHIITSLNHREKPIIFVLWGKPAQAKLKLINTEKHATILAPHPSPLSAHRGFFGSKPFSKINQKLLEWGEKPIDWKIDNI
ncbi:uracil-DNA glycosylase [Cytobacillus sp. FSL M8-0252]|uniref:uracil-DNA glycosylase n=1 Tax=Cytobacillus TaxID=2675230 RepID=UPI00247FEAEB|nr:uracil-DNA glycosylase [Cytobacillus kochii]